MLGCKWVRVQESPWIWSSMEEHLRKIIGFTTSTAITTGIEVPYNQGIRLILVPRFNNWAQMRCPNRRPNKGPK